MTENPLDVFESEPVAEPEKKKKKRKIIFWIILLLVLLVALLTGGYLFNLVRTFDSNVEKVNINQTVNGEKRPDAIKGKGTNYLLLGSDKREEKEARLSRVFGERSDVMMFVHVDEEKKHAYVMSIPRDLYIDVPGHGTDRVNAGLAYGGMGLAVKTVENYVGVPIDHAAMIRFDGITGLVDSIGGIDVNIVKTIDAAGVHFEQGQQHLNGKEALIYVRQRYQYAEGDFQRNANQREVLRAILAKVLTPEVMANPITIQNMVSQLAPFMVLDQDLTTPTIVSTAFSMRDISNKEIFYLSFPHGEPMVGKGGASVVAEDPAAMDKLRKAIKEDDMGTYYAENAGK